MVGSAFLVTGKVVDKGEQSDALPDPTGRIAPGFTVYSLSGLVRNQGAGTTSVTFDSTDLPFVFSSLLFVAPSGGGTDSVYYAGSGMILNVTGPHGNITLKEQSGKTVRTVEYEGQPSIVINGEAAYTSTPKAYAEFEGTEILIQDWLKGTWTPEKGVVLERPAGMTIDTTEFYVMVFQSPNAVPEFGALPLVSVAVALVCILAFRRKTK